MKHALLLSVAFLATALAPAPSPANTPAPSATKSLPSGGMTVKEVASWLQSKGYEAKIETGNNGYQTIQTALGGADFYIDMYDCHKSPRCASLEFWVGFNTKGASDASKMDEWNRNHRWVRAYVDKANDPWLEMDVDLYPGGTYEGLNDQFAIWRHEFSSFRNYIHW